MHIHLSETEALSAFANFYLISKRDFDEYRKMAQIPPILDIELPPGAEQKIHILTQKEMNSPAFKKMQEHYKKLWDFLHKHGKEPYEYQWSGYTLYDLLGWLKDIKNIDLMEHKFTPEEDAELEWLIFDEDTKKKYLDKLNPANYKAEDVIYSYEHLCEQRKDAEIKQMAAKLSKQEMKAYLAQMKDYEESEAKYKAADGLTKAKERAETSKAMMDGIAILHKYLQLVGGESIVILNIG